MNEKEKEKEIEKILEKIDLLKMTSVARSIGVAVNNIYLALKGDIKITHKLAYKIEEVTNGFLTMEELLAYGDYIYKGKKEKVKDNG